MTIDDLNSLVQNVFNENYIGDMIKKGLLYKKIPIRLKKTSLHYKLLCMWKYDAKPLLCPKLSEKGKEWPIERVNRSTERWQKLCRNCFDLYDANPLLFQQYNFRNLTNGSFKKRLNERWRCLKITRFEKSAYNF